MNKLSLLFVLSIIGFSCNNISHSTRKEIVMREVAAKFIESLKKADTTSALALFDAEPFSDRHFYAENILFHGEIYQKIIGKYGDASLQNLKLGKDSVLGTNLALLPLLPKPDTSLNLKYFNLELKFYPDRWFNGKILHYTIDVGVLDMSGAEPPPTN